MREAFASGAFVSSTSIGMALTKRQKALCILCAACIAILVIDRTRNSSKVLGPHQAEASMYSAKAAGSAAATASADALRDIDFSGEEVTTLANRLEEYASKNSQGRGSGEFSHMTISDAFAPLAPWCAPRAKPARNQVVVPGRNAAVEFAESHRLTAVAVSSDGKMAVVNNTCLQVGDSLDGFRLVAVEKNSALFQKGERQVALELNKPGGPGSD